MMATTVVAKEEPLKTQIKDQMEEPLETEILKKPDQPQRNMTLNNTVTVVTMDVNTIKASSSRRNNNSPCKN